MLIKAGDSARMREIILTVIFAAAAALLFVPLFVVRGFGPVDFWWWMSAALVILIISGVIADRNYFLALLADLKTNALWKILAGLGAAFLLFMVFYMGNILSRYLIDIAGRNINAVYQFKGDAAPVRIVILMALIIGPGEELFWRGFLQRRLSNSFGEKHGFAAATSLYAMVHLASGNIMLVLAALVCGIFWGFLYFRYKSLVINIVSHTVWDIAVFILFPFTG